MQTAQATTPSPVQAESTFAFVNSIGVVTHNNDADDAYAALQPYFVSEMQYLGIDQAAASLDSISFSGGGGLHYWNILSSEMSQGIKFYFSVSDNLPIATAIAELNAIETVHPGMITYVVGQNEVPVANLGAAQAYQDQFYAALKADPLLAGVGDVTFSIGSMTTSVYTSLGDQSANAGYGNVHSYAGIYPPQIYDSFYTLVNASTTPEDPFIINETGFATVPPGSPAGGGGTYDTGAKYLPDTIFDFLLDGATTVDLYELLDQFSDPNNTNGTEDHFGFFTVTGQPKPVATTLHNLTTIIADPGANASSFTPGTLSYSVSGLDSTLNTSAAETAFGDGIFTTYVNSSPVYGASYLLEKSNGVFDIAVWREPSIYDNTTGGENPAPAVPVSVTLAQTAASIEVFDPLVGTAPIATYYDVSAVTVMVSASPIIIEVDPFAPGSTPAASTSPPIETVGSGPDTLTLFVAGTGQPGGAQFTVTVDGLQIGGVQTTSAVSANGQAQQFNFLGSFAQGENSVVVSYLNANNSVLYIDSVDINGTYMPGSYYSLGNTGSVSTAVSQSSGPAAVSLGSGPNTLVLFFSEAGAPGGAQFTISVDGQQIGGVQTTTANAASGQVQQFDVAGTFAAGNNMVTIDYLNANNSTLYLDSATINGVGVAANTLALSNNGDGDMSFALSNGPGPVSLGSGSDTLAVFVSERGEPSGARFTISVDGQQVGGVQTTTADAVQGQTQQYDVFGSFGGGNHTVSVDYLNANNSLFFVNGAAIDGTTVANSALFYGNSGTLNFGFAKAGAIPQAVAAVVSTVAAVASTPSGITNPPSSSNSGSSSGASTNSAGANSPTSNNGSTNSTGTVVLGSGPDTLALTMSERANANGAQFVVTVDGQQIGGVQTTTANSLAGQTQTFDVEGAFAAGNHSVAITYLNAANSLLYVDGTTIDGVAVPNGSTTLNNNGTLGYSFTAAGGASTAGSSASTTQVLGSGSDTLALVMSERAAAAGAQFTISVDGQQVGGVQTTSANSTNGQSQIFDVLGNFAGSNTVSINYLNASNSLLYVNNASIDGNTVPGGNITLSNNGTQTVGFNEPATQPGAAAIGSGPDKLDLYVSERGAPAGAQFVVDVDGQQIGGVLATNANQPSGQEQQFDILGSFGQGGHSVSIDYLNASNSIFFVNTATINGATINGSSLVDPNNGASGFTFATPAAPPTTTIGNGPDTLALTLSEDYYQGNAQFTVSVDGQQVGGVQTAQAIAGNGQSQVLDVLGNFSGSHNVSVNFLNDASGAQASQGNDRNLFVGGATIDGTGIANSSLNLYFAGSGSFAFNH